MMAWMIGVAAFVSMFDAAAENQSDYDSYTCSARIEPRLRLVAIAFLARRSGQSASRRLVLM